jgi:hypothetical protein
MSLRHIIGGRSPPYEALEGRDGLKKVKFLKFGVQKKSVRNRKPLPIDDFGQNREKKRNRIVYLARSSSGILPLLPQMRQDAASMEVRFFVERPKYRSARSRAKTPRILREKRHSRYSEFVESPKTPEKRPTISWKKYRKVKNRRDIPTISSGVGNVKSLASDI